MRHPLILQVTLMAVWLIGHCPSSMADDKFTCPVTRPAKVEFEPKGPFTGRAADLFGDEKLFTLFPGNWHYAQQ